MLNFQPSLFLILTFGILSAFTFAQDDEPIKVDSSIVILNATVTGRDGKAVTALNTNQFKVYEDGKEQQIAYFAAEKTPFAAVILIDTSGSMESRVSMARAAAINFLNGLRNEDFAAIYNFDSKVSLIQDFSNSRDVPESTFDLKADGMTVLNDAIFQAAEVLSKRPEKRRAIVVLSDGADTHSRKSDSKALNAALAANATIYTVDMSAMDNTLNPGAGALKNFSEKSGGVFVAASGGVLMRDAFKAIVEELGAQYTLGYQPSSAGQDGKWHSLEVRVSKPNLQIRTRKGYNSKKIQSK